MASATIQWAPNLPGPIAVWMREVGLHEPKRFGLTIGQDNQLAYQQAVEMCSKASGLSEELVAAQFFELLDLHEGAITISSHALLNTSTEELAAIGLAAKREIRLESVRSAGTNLQTTPSGPRARVRKHKLKASFVRPAFRKIGIFRQVPAKTGTAGHDRES